MHSQVPLNASWYFYPAWAMSLHPALQSTVRGAADCNTGYPALYAASLSFPVRRSPLGPDAKHNPHEASTPGAHHIDTAHRRYGIVH